MVTVDIAGTADHIVDVTDEAAVAAAVDAIVAEHGRLDSVVNAAGVAGGGPVHLMPMEEWARVIAVNLTGTFIVAKQALRPMVEQGSGSIINIASIEGIEGTEGGSAYNASKGGVVLLTKNLAIDYGRAGVRANAICPGFIETPMMHEVMDLPQMSKVRDTIRDHHKLGRFGQPSEIAGAALFLASEDCVVRHRARARRRRRVHGRAAPRRARGVRPLTEAVGRVRGTARRPGSSDPTWRIR